MAIAVQTYRLATALATPGRAAGSWGVILDADDTVINNLNARPDWRVMASGTRRRFTAFVRSPPSTAFRAADFLARVHALGGRIAIVTIDWRSNATTPPPCCDD
jgi:hypothetical protein